jgi:hypothetical protein
MNEPAFRIFDAEKTSTVADFLRAVCKDIPASVPREKIEAALDGFNASYGSHPDVHARCSYFSEELVFEDPIGISRGNTREALRSFFLGTLDSGLGLERSIVQRVTTGDEAIERVHLNIHPKDGQPTSLPHIAHYVFDSAGHIKSLRVFFDIHCIGQ